MLDIIYNNNMKLVIEFNAWGGGVAGLYLFEVVRMWFLFVRNTQKTRFDILRHNWTEENLSLYQNSIWVSRKVVSKLGKSPPLNVISFLLRIPM